MAFPTNGPEPVTAEAFEAALQQADAAVSAGLTGNVNLAGVQLRPKIMPVIDETADHPTLAIEALVLQAWMAKLLQETDGKALVAAKDARLLNIAMDAVLRRMPR